MKKSLPNIGTGSREWASRLASEPLWDTWSNTLFPKNLESALYYANWLRTRNGDLVAAVKRGICYFLNGIEISSDTADMDSKDLYIDKLEKEHKILQQILAAALDLQFYGNSFTSVARAITRTLVCPNCGTMRYLRNMVRGIDYDFERGKFISTCPSCRKYKGEMKIKDFIDYSSDKELMVMSWSPLAISLDHCSITGAEKISYIPTEKEKSFIENVSESAALESLPNCLLQALSTDSAIEFKQDGCLHLVLPRDSMNAGELKGWGLPGFLPAFKYIVMLMLLERQTEAAIKDFMLPIRLLFPAPNTSRGGSDPISMAGNSLHMGEFRATVEKALRSQARHQASWQLIPAPVDQVQLGGDGKAVAPVELLQFAKDNLLDCYCIPSEFSRTQFTGIGGIPAASLRTFEQTWEREVNQMELYLNWYLRNCSQLLGWPLFKGELIRQSILTDPNRINFMQAMNQQGLISNTTMMRSMNINPKQERSRLIEDQINQNKLQMEIEDRIKKTGIVQQFNQQSLDAAMQGAQAAAQGGDPAAQGGGEAGAAPAPAPGMSTGNPQMDIQNLASVRTPNSVSPEQLQADAQMVAQILMTTPIGSARNQIYSMVKGLNKTLYDIAKSILQSLENQAKQQGVEQARQGGM